MLTKQEMKNAVFSRSYPKNSADEVRSDEWALTKGLPKSERNRLVAQAVSDYEQGQKVLQKYTLSFSSSFPAGLAPVQSDIEDSDGWMVVDAGYIASAPMECAAIFRKR